MNKLKRCARSAIRVFAVLVCACGVEPVRNEGMILTAHNPTQAAPGTPKRAVGESCETNGSSICSSNLCVHAAAEQGRGYVCSTPCQRHNDCPQDWRCVSILPGPRNSYCFPPEELESQTSNAAASQPHKSRPRCAWSASGMGPAALV